MEIPSYTYKPSLVAKIAKYILPLARQTLPPALYTSIYKASYFSYKELLRYSYLIFLISNIFSDKTRKIRAKLTWQLLPYTMGGRKALENAFDVVEEIERSKISGALVECGVAEGGTAAMLALANRQLGSSIRAKWLFDSFEGLPEPTEEDFINGRAGEFIRPLPKGACLGTIEQVSELMFDTLKLDRDEVSLVKGWFQDTVPLYKNRIGPISILRLDGDWYESTKIPLENFYDLISDGGVVIIDDYATCFGSKRATDEFRSSRSISSPLIPDGRGGVWFKKV